MATTLPSTEIPKTAKTVADFIKSNSDLKFQNLALTSRALDEQLAKQQQQQQQTSSSSPTTTSNIAVDPERQQELKDAAFSKIYYIFLDSDESLPMLKDRLGKAFFVNDRNDSHNMILTADAEWFQPKGVHFSDWTQTKIALLQIGLKPASSALLNRVALPHPQRPGESGSNSSTLPAHNFDDDACIVLVFDIFAGKNLSQSSPSLRLFLNWIFNVTSSQPRLAFDIRCDAKVLNALDVDICLQGEEYNYFYNINNNTNTNTNTNSNHDDDSETEISKQKSKSVRSDKIIDLQLVEVAISGNPIRTSRDKPLAFLCMVPGMAKTLDKFPTLSWFATLKKALKIRGNAEKMSLDHFVRRPIDLETMIYTVADAGMLFHLFDEMLKAYHLHFANPTFVQALIRGGDVYANLPRTGVEPKYDDNAFLPLGILDRIDNRTRGDQICCKCKRAVARSTDANLECVVCTWITQRWIERD